MRILVLASISLTISIGMHAQYVETFESGLTNGATSFQAPTGEVFNLTNDFRIYEFPTFGANSSDWFIDTGVLEGNDNDPPAQILLADPNKVFLLDSLYMWTSNDDGANLASGTITMTGTGPSGMRLGR